MSPDREHVTPTESTRQPAREKARPRTGRSALGDPARLALLQRLHLLDGRPEAFFDRLVRLAHVVLDAPVALLSMVDDSHQHFKAAIGLDGAAAETRKTPLSHSFCQHVVTSGRPLIVEDARIDPLVRDNLAVPELSVIAYLGMPVTSPDGFVLGSFCVIDARPRLWTTREIELLRELSEILKHEIASRLDRIALEARLQAGEAQHLPAAGSVPGAQTPAGPEPGPLAPAPSDAPCPDRPPSAGDVRPAGDTAGVLDPLILEECRNLPGRRGRSILADIIDLYLELESDRMKNLEEARTQRDFRSLAAHAHTIAGSCANLGATEARSLLLDLEAAARSEDAAAFTRLFEPAKAALARTHAAVVALQQAEANRATSRAP